MLCHILKVRSSNKEAWQEPTSIGLLVFVPYRHRAQVMMGDKNVTHRRLGELAAQFWRGLCVRPAAEGQYEYIYSGYMYIYIYRDRERSICRPGC